MKFQILWFHVLPKPFVLKVYLLGNCDGLLSAQNVASQISFFFKIPNTPFLFSLEMWWPSPGSDIKFYLPPPTSNKSSSPSYSRRPIVCVLQQQSRPKASFLLPSYLLLFRWISFYVFVFVCYCIALFTLIDFLIFSFLLPSFLLVFK